MKTRQFHRVCSPEHNLLLPADHVDPIAPPIRSHGFALHRVQSWYEVVERPEVGMDFKRRDYGGLDIA